MIEHIKCEILTLVKSEEYMAVRKQFRTRPVPNQKPLALLAEKKDVEVSEAELLEQRISFAYGNAGDSENITKASVRAASQKIRLFA